MSCKIKNTTALLSVLAFLCVGCSRYVAFPELEENSGTLISDSENVTYSDSLTATKIVEVKTNTLDNTQTAVETPKVKAQSKEKKRDLSQLAPEVDEISSDAVSYVVPSKTTPSVITDMDLIEMDATDTPKKSSQKVTSKNKVVSNKKTTKAPVDKKNNIASSPSVFYLAETIHFNNGGSTVDSSYYKTLRNIVREAKNNNGKIIVQGFASSRTRNTDIVSHKMANLKVSVARAENVAKLLKQFGMPSNRIVVEGLSDSRPLYKEVMPEGERLNRRAEIYISY